MKKIILLGIVAMAIFTSTFASDPKTILIYGHRGARGLAPENTLPGYRTALTIGVDYIDMDIGITKDGIIVVTHDFALNPDLTHNLEEQWIGDNQILIKDLTWKELQTYDVGQLKPGTKYNKDFPDQKAFPGTHIPSLKQAIDYAKRQNNKIKFLIEIKTDPSHPEWTFPPEQITKKVVTFLKKEGIDNRTELQAFDWRVLQAVQKIDPKIATAYLTEKASEKQMTNDDPKIAGLWTAGYLLKNYDNSIPKMISQLGGKIWGPEYTQLNKGNVAEAHQHGLKVVPWTVDTKKAMEQMINLQVDGIITDRPDILRDVLIAHKLPVPEATK